MLSFSGFLRRLARDAVLAGVEDAMRFLEPQVSHDAPARMAAQLAERLKRLHQNCPAQEDSAATRLNHPLSGAGEEQPPQLPKPESNGQPPTGQKPLPQRKRGPGRPKKHPHPHAQ